MPRAFEAKPDNPAVHALLRLHADIGGRRKANKAEAKKLAEDMKHVEAVIRMFSPGYDVTRIAARRHYKVNPWFKRGECFRAGLDVLRKAEGPLTAREISLRALRERGVTDPPLKVLRTMIGAVQRSLQNREGSAVHVIGEGIPAKWTISREKT